MIKKSFASGKGASGSSGGGETSTFSSSKKQFYEQQDQEEEGGQFNNEQLEGEEGGDKNLKQQQFEQEQQQQSFSSTKRKQKEGSSSSSYSKLSFSKNFFISMLSSWLDYFSGYSYAFFNQGYGLWQRYLAPYFSFYQLFWLSFGGGGFLLFQYMFIGFLSLFTVIGIPFSYNAFKLAFYGLKPTFEIDAADSHSLWNRVRNTVWFFSMGWMFSLTNIFFAIFLTIFPFSRSFAQDHLRLLELNVAPFGKKLCYGGSSNAISGGGGAKASAQKSNDATALPWKTQEAKNMQLLVQEEMGVVEQRFNEKSLSGNVVAMQLDEVFDKYYKSSNQVQESARNELKQKLQSKLDKRLQFWQNGFIQVDENVRQIRLQVERIIESNFNELRADMETVKSELKNANDAHKKALEDVTMLQQEADRFRAFEQRFYEAQERNTNDAEKYEQQIQYLQQSIEKEVSRTRQFEDQSMQMKQQYQQAQLQFDNLKRENEKLKGEWKQQEQEINRLKTTQAQVEKMRGERDSLAQELLKFQESQVRNLNSFNDQISHLQGKLKRVEDELGIAKSALYSSQNDREKDRETIKQMKKKFELLSNLEEERNRLQTQVDSMKEDMTRMERESKHQILSLEQHYQSELKGLQKWREERIKVQEELNELRKNKLNQDELISERNLFQKELEVVQANYKRLQEDVALISQSRDETEEKNRDLLKDLHKLNSTLNKQATKIVVEQNDQLARESVSSSMSKS